MSRSAPRRGLAVAAALAAAPACASAPSSADALGREAAAAIQVGDGDAFAALFLPADSIRDACEGRLADSVDQVRDASRQGVNECFRSLAGRRVRRVDVFGGAPLSTITGCDARVVSLDVLGVTWEIEGPDGVSFVRANLYDAVAFEDGFHLGGALSCGSAPAAFDFCRDLAATARRLAKEGGTSPEAAGAELVGRCERSGDRALAIVACAAAAQDLDALRACYKDLPEVGDLPNFCQRFVEKYRECVEAMPEAAREPAREGIQAMVDAWGAVEDPTALDSACRTAFESAGPSMSAICPDVDWSLPSR